MVGRGFGVVMAYSFCCAPLHAVRPFAQPPQGAGMGLSGPNRTCFTLVVERRISCEMIATDRIRWLSTGGVSSLGNARQMGLNARHHSYCIDCDICAAKATGSPAATLY